ncbi:2Fe-2S iron-sulfur cluster-binding protein [Yunchengibacter salinarum]|uniref:2Fe-2S iron-sulfur cluster-binding protein n=1 Tax=Yunchengibacter salinarum TaxID=3133399 RepID=UPI0035B64943
MSTISVTFIQPDGTVVEGRAEPGTTVLQLAQELGLDMEGTCEGHMACSTCHVIVDDADFDRLPESCEEEEEMLDLAAGVTATSRLGCQIVLSPAMDGLRLTLPRVSRNMMGAL